jgi:superfamily I DNA and RNA helicase
MISSEILNAVVNYCIFQLGKDDASVKLRQNIISVFSFKDPLELKIYKERYNIKDSEELVFIDNANKYISTIKTKMKSRLKSMEEKEVINIMNDTKCMKNFIKEYIHSKEELDNDKLLQCH